MENIKDFNENYVSPTECILLPVAKVVRYADLLTDLQYKLAIGLAEDEEESILLNKYEIDYSTFKTEMDKVLKILNGVP